MVHPITTAYRLLLRKLARQFLLIAVILAVSGAPAHVIQGVAWWQMAKKSGGLTEAMFEAAPCKLCGTARNLGRDSDDEPNSPAPADRLQALRLVATVAEILSVPTVRPGGDARKNLAVRPVIPPGTSQDRPPTPPPQSFA